MSRISPVFHLTILLLPTSAALVGASPALADAELRRLPIVFNQLAGLDPAHRLTLHNVRSHHRSQKPHAENKSERLARAANLLVAGGYTDIRELHTEGDHVAAVVVQDDETQHLIITKDGAVAAGDTAAAPGPSVASSTVTDTSSPLPNASTSTGASGPASEPISAAPVAAPDPSLPAMPDANVTEPQVQAAAAAGSTSDAARPGALSASSSSTP